MADITLQVDGYYKTRAGEIVRVVKHHPLSLRHWNPFHVFTGSNGALYTKAGRTALVGQRAFDLVESVPEGDISPFVRSFYC